MMFEGFSDATIDFMWGIRLNNEKPWFEANKPTYLQHLYEPMRALCRQVYQVINDARPDLHLSCKVSRIYRDARRLHGNGPYKDHLWFSIEQPTEDWTSHPVFWFELSPEDYCFGMGYYAAKAATTAKFRARLDNTPKPFEKMVRKFQQQDRFVLECDLYKRPKGDPGPLLFDWYNCKTLSLICRRKHDQLLYTPALADELVAGYTELLPFFEYFSSLDSDPDPRTP